MTNYKPILFSPFIIIIAMSATAIGSDLYGISLKSDGLLIRIDTVTETATQIGPLDVKIGNSGLSFHPDGTLYLFAWSKLYKEHYLYTVDIDTGKATAVGPFKIHGGSSGELVDLAIDSRGTMYGIINDEIFTINRETGEGEGVVYAFDPKNKVQINGADFSFIHYPLDTDTDGILFASGEKEGDKKLFYIDVKNKHHETVPKPYKSPGLAFGFHQETLYGTADGEFFEIDPETGNRTILNDKLGFGKVVGIDAYPSLTTDKNEVDGTMGTDEVTLRINAGVENAGRLYLILGSMTGTGSAQNPAYRLPKNGAVFPLIWDCFTNLSANEILKDFEFSNFFGNLDADGKSQAVFKMKGPLIPGIGHTMHFSCILEGPPTYPAWDFASTPISIEIK